MVLSKPPLMTTVVEMVRISFKERIWHTCCRVEGDIDQTKPTHNAHHHQIQQTHVPLSFIFTQSTFPRCPNQVLTFFPLSKSHIPTLPSKLPVTSQRDLGPAWRHVTSLPSAFSRCETTRPVHGSCRRMARVSGRTGVGVALGRL
ncbi:hypothetical protein BC936DRAFT_148363 [Jimgerdemannia flammicorona]|uniref:Uncharacterized protein n=1 Tax=Jimgerdemannia flammicorona TaxID=994334 RepID=A0A433D397_9FUNG|nr:hypothetical protein BC936DRAFT_148363 [Jimgerdemannia flammicorona]